MKVKNDYFKHTTRTLLTEQQKRETIKAIERGCRYLSNRMQEYKIEEVSLKNGYQIIYSSRRKMIYLSRWVNLVKGYTQPKHLYRHRRRSEISHRAFLIARDTGANFEEVKEQFFELMPEYVRMNER